MSDVLEYLLKCAELEHVGDRNAMAVMFISAAAQQDIETQGIQHKVSGSLGKGKTDLCRAFVHLIGNRHATEATLSDKAIFYATDVTDGQILFCDDSKLSSELEGIIKRAASNFQTPIEYMTLDKQNKPVTKVMPSRIMWLLTGVEDTESQELLSRCMQSHIDETHEQDIKVEQYIKANRDILHRRILTDDELNQCHSVWDDIKSKRFLVNIPPHITSQLTQTGRRSLKMLVDIIVGVCILEYKNRQRATIQRMISTKTTDEKGNSSVKSTVTDVIMITATENDLADALSVVGLSAGDEVRLSRGEQLVYDSLGYGIDEGKSQDQLQNTTGLSQPSVSYALHGRRNGKSKGLLEKRDNVQKDNKRVTIRTDESTTESREVWLYFRTDAKPVNLIDNRPKLKSWEKNEQQRRLNEATT